jgi:hypothetical protein
MTTDKKTPVFIRDLMPNATEAELEQAAENFREYLAIVIRIHERLKREAAAADSTNHDYALDSEHNAPVPGG